MNLLDIVFGQVRVLEQPDSPSNYVGSNFLHCKTDVRFELFFVAKTLGSWIYHEPGSILISACALRTVQVMANCPGIRHLKQVLTLLNQGMCCFEFWGKVQDTQALRNRCVHRREFEGKLA